MYNFIVVVCVYVVCAGGRGGGKDGKGGSAKTGGQR